MISITEWTSVYVELPKTSLCKIPISNTLSEKVGYNYAKWDRSALVLCLAQDMERPEYINQDWLQYVKNWELAGLDSAWVHIELHHPFTVTCYNVDWWCERPGEPKNIQAGDFKEGRNKYTLSQLRKTWGAGFHQGAEAQMKANN